MSGYYLAIDIGASSGRHILGSVENGKMVLEEVHRFENGMEKKDGHRCWNLDKLFAEIKAGLKKCKDLGKIPVSVGIDTWGVDYVLLDEKEQVLGPTYGYRDARTEGMDREVYKLISPEELYERTASQKQMFNTIYQLMAVKTQEPELMEKARFLLMIPDYFHFLLTGNPVQEYTEASTSQLMNPFQKVWDYPLIERLGYKKELFGALSMPGTRVGRLLPEVQKEVGFDCEVILPASHDTASAVMAVPCLRGTCLYLSSGTWSLMGIESKEPICTKESMERNFTNEGGYEYRFRFLKNIMGLWMIQSVRHELQDAYSFAELCEMAEKKKDFPSRVDVNHKSFMDPENMTEAIKEYCRNTGQAVPEDIGEIATVIYQSLAEFYAATVKEIEEVSGRSFDRIHIVGGGSNADYLNKLTAEKSGIDVYAGPGEATAIGNLMAQMIEYDEFSDIWDARKCVYDSFEIKRYKTY